MRDMQQDTDDHLPQLAAARRRSGWWSRCKQSRFCNPYPFGYTILVNTFLRSDVFDEWLTDLKDKVGRARILHRIRAAELGNLGDCEPVGEGVSEMRIHVGPGYRVYFTRRGSTVYLLLVGGDKSSQKRDIRRAIAMARSLEKE